MKQHTIHSSNTGDILYGGLFDNMSLCLENAIIDRADLDYACLKNANLINANLDELDATSVDFSGANLMGANISDAKLKNANFKNTNLRGTCLAFSTLENIDFTGSLFGGTDISGSTIIRCRYDTISALSQNFIDTEKLYNCLYIEVNKAVNRFSQPPVYITGLDLPVALFDTQMKIGYLSKPYSEWVILSNDNGLRIPGADSLIHSFFHKHQTALTNLARNRFQCQNHMLWEKKSHTIEQIS